MLRLLLSAMLIFALPAAAPAASLGKKGCDATRDILVTAVAGRQAGQSAKQITTRLTKGPEAVEEKYIPTVDTLVNLVFALNKAALNDKFIADYEALCLKYKQ